MLGKKHSQECKKATVFIKIERELKSIIYQQKRKINYEKKTLFTFIASPIGSNYRM